jgi:hypothetical protein
METIHTHELPPLIEADVSLKVEELRVLQEAKRRLAEATNPYEVPVFRTITEVPDRPKWRIEDLISTGSYVLISAQKKSGKTTLGLNLIRALINGEPFLGEFRVHGQAKVALIDLEMSDYHLASWMNDVGLLGDERLVTMGLRGQAKALGIFDDIRREQVIQQLQDHAVDVLIIDPLGPLLRAYGMDENSNTEVGQAIDMIYQMAQDAGVSELIIMHHHGKDDGLGARGASVLMDTPVALWQLKRDDRTGLAALSTEGRDGSLIRRLEFNERTRTLTAMVTGDTYVPPTNGQALLDTLTAATEPLSIRDVWERARGFGYTSNREKCSEDLQELLDRGQIKSEGAGNRKKWSVPGKG